MKEWRILESGRPSCLVISTDQGQEGSSSPSWENNRKAKVTPYGQPMSIRGYSCCRGRLSVLLLLPLSISFKFYQTHVCSAPYLFSAISAQTPCPLSPHIYPESIFSTPPSFRFRSRPERLMDQVLSALTCCRSSPGTCHGSRVLSSRHPPTSCLSSHSCSKGRWRFRLEG